MDRFLNKNTPKKNSELASSPQPKKFAAPPALSPEERLANEKSKPVEENGGHEDMQVDCEKPNKSAINKNAGKLQKTPIAKKRLKRMADEEEKLQMSSNTHSDTPEQKRDGPSADQTQNSKTNLQDQQAHSNSKMEETEDSKDADITKKKRGRKPKCVSEPQDPQIVKKRERKRKHKNASEPRQTEDANHAKPSITDAKDRLNHLIKAGNNSTENLDKSDEKNNEDKETNKNNVAKGNEENDDDMGLHNHNAQERLASDQACNPGSHISNPEEGTCKSLARPSSCVWNHDKSEWTCRNRDNSRSDARDESHLEDRLSSPSAGSVSGSGSKSKRKAKSKAKKELLQLQKQKEKEEREAQKLEAKRKQEEEKEIRRSE